MASLMLAGVVGVALASGKAADDVVGLVKGLMAHGSDWRSIEEVKGIAWQKSPPKMLEHCLPDGECFTLLGDAKLAGRPVKVMATGARTMTSNFYIKNSGPRVGEAALVAAMASAGLSPEVARCPIRPSERRTAQFEVVAGEVGRARPRACVADLFVPCAELRGCGLQRRGGFAGARSGGVVDVQRDVRRGGRVCGQAGVDVAAA
jgi:hypothetical protein